MITVILTFNPVSYMQLARATHAKTALRLHYPKANGCDSKDLAWIISPLIIFYMGEWNSLVSAANVLVASWSFRHPNTSVHQKRTGIARERADARITPWVRLARLISTVMCPRA
jgi:hypothetical protein